MHIISYVLSYDHPLQDRWIPDEEEYNEIVKCDYCNVQDFTKEELLHSFTTLLRGMFPGNPELKGSITKNGYCEVVVPKGVIRKYLEAEIGKLKKKVGEITPDNYTDVAHYILDYVDYVDAWDNVFVEISDGGIEDYETGLRSLARSLKDNDKKATTIYVYGAINHHI